MNFIRHENEALLDDTFERIVIKKVQRRARKWLTIISASWRESKMEEVAKSLRKNLNCRSTVKEVDPIKSPGLFVIELTGDKGREVANFLVVQKFAKDSEISLLDE